MAKFDDSEVDPIEEMLASGKFSDSTDVTEVAALLAGQTSTEIDDKDEVPPVDAPAKVDEPAAKVDTPAPADADDSDIAGEDEPQNFKNHPIHGVLKGTRQTLAQTREAAKRREEELLAQNAELQRQMEELKARPGADAKDALQTAADSAGMVDEAGNPIDVSAIDINVLRENYDGPIVEAIAQLQTVMKFQTTEITRLRAREAQREEVEQVTVQEALQRDIDAVPKLAEWQADSDQVMYEAAVAVDQQLMKNPEWRSKSRVERFQEVVKRLGGNAQPVQQQQSGTDLVRQKVAQAAAKSTPHSLSELPSGTPAGQSEFETLGNLDVTQLAEKMAGMTPAQQEALAARLG